MLEKIVMSGENAEAASCETVMLHHATTEKQKRLPATLGTCANNVRAFIDAPSTSNQVDGEIQE